jgi:nitroimidazol reductase NimA-like FMN-containing flavoprotein (pyridoxamine 5'-phosphate oxidase superfamily)
MAATKPSPRMTADECWSFVSDTHTGILTTLRRDGTPIALPLWFACLDRTIYLQTRGRKLERIRHNPLASFLVETGDHWADLKAVHLTGRAEIVDLDDELSRRFRFEMDRKYKPFSTVTAMPAETADYYAQALTGVVRFSPDERILNWDNAKIAVV